MQWKQCVLKAVLRQPLPINVVTVSEELSLVVERKHLSVWDAGTATQREHVTGAWLGFSLHADDAGNLDHRVDTRFWKNSLSPHAFDIKAENGKRCDLGPFPLRLT